MSETQRLFNQFQKAQLNRDDYALRLVQKQLDRQRKVLDDQGNKYYSSGNFEQAIKAYKDVLFIARLSEDARTISTALIVLANAYAHAGNLSQAAEYYEEAAALIKSNDKVTPTTPRSQMQKVDRSSYLELWLQLVSHRFYLATLVFVLFAFIAIGLTILLTRNPLLLFTFQLPVLLLYIMSYYFHIGGRDKA